MAGWVLAGGLFATALTVVGLVVGAGSWLSGTPSWHVGFRVMAGLLLGAWVVVCGGSAVAVTAYEEGWVGPKFWFELEVPAGYTGEVALRFCPSEGEPLGDVVVVDDLGLATVRGPAPGQGDRYRFDVVRRDGTRTQGHRTQQRLSDDCEWLAVAIADEPWTVVNGQGHPAGYAAIARRRGVTYAVAARGLPYEIVVPDGYRGDVALTYCYGGPAPGDVVTVDATGIGRLDGPMPTTQPDPDPFPVREAGGAPLVGRMTRVEWGAGNCSYVEVRVADAAPAALPWSPMSVEARVADAVARGAPYATVSPPP